MFVCGSVLLLALFFSASHCTDVYITSPYDVISWVIGKQETVTWNILPGGPAIDAFNVDLMDGQEISANVVCNIARGLPITSTSATWVVPDSIAPGKNYFVRVSSPDLALQRYSHRFAINGVQCTTKSTTSVTTSSANASSKASQSTSTSGTLTKTSASGTETPSDATVTRSVPSNSAALSHDFSSSKPSLLLAMILLILFTIF